MIMETESPTITKFGLNHNVSDLILRFSIIMYINKLNDKNVKIIRLRYSLLCRFDYNSM